MKSCKIFIFIFFKRVFLMVGEGTLTLSRSSCTEAPGLASVYTSGSLKLGGKGKVLSGDSLNVMPFCVCHGRHLKREAAARRSVWGKVSSLLVVTLGCNKDNWCTHLGGWEVPAQEPENLWPWLWHKAWTCSFGWPHP